MPIVVPSGARTNLVLPTKQVNYCRRVNYDGNPRPNERKRQQPQTATTTTMVNRCTIYMSIEELRACTTCNACVEECPVVSPLSIIMEMRRHLILDEFKSPEEWNLMFGNIETNGAVWKSAKRGR